MNAAVVLLVITIASSGSTYMRSFHMKDMPTCVEKMGEAKEAAIYKQEESYGTVTVCTIEDGYRLDNLGNGNISILKDGVFTEESMGKGQWPRKKH